VAAWAGKFDAAATTDASRTHDDLVEREVGPRVRAAGFATRDDLLALCRWKSPRALPRCAANSPDYVEAVTRAAFGSTHERVRVEALTLLDGVGWPMASVLLHFGHPDPYPILDVRAFAALGQPLPAVHGFDVWWPYVERSRALAEQYRVDMRTLDKALWRYERDGGLL
jgi:hypothetical protein